MKNNTAGNIFFRKISLVTLVAVYFLILVGGIVRSTGAGMGCPDWPRCFGQWIPPTGEENLPPDYQEKYVEGRLEKNRQFAGYLEVLGFEKQAEMIRTDEAIRQKTPFNVMKTWTEYLNRLVGVLVGLLIMVNLAASIRMIKTDPPLFLWSVALFLLVVFQGWIGSIVVSTHLVPWMVTLHMLIAVVIVAVLVYLVYRSRRTEMVFQDHGHSPMLKTLLVISGLLIMVQILLGTQVRESVDIVALALNYTARESWIGKLGMGFYIHRSFSLVLVALQAGILIMLYRNRKVADKTWYYARILLGLVLAEIGFGIILAYFALPPFIQPVHLLTGILIFGIQFLILLMVSNPKEVLVEKKVLA